MDSSKLTDIFTSRIIGSCGVNQHQAQSFIQFMIGSQALFMKQLYGSQKETNMHVDHSASNNQLSPLSTTLPLMAPKPVRPIPINLITKESITFVPPTLHHHAKCQSQKSAVRKSSDSSNHRPTIATASCQATTVSSLSTFQRARVLMDAKIKVLIRSWQGWCIWDEGVKGI